MTKPRAFISSVCVCVGKGPHDYVNVFIRGQNVGTLVVGKGDAEPLRAVLMREPDHTKAEAGSGASAPSRRAARKAARKSTRTASAAGAPPTYRPHESERPPAGDAR